MVVGIALEDFTPTRAYSDTYINQFGDDLVDPVVTPINPYNDPRINDGCYFGGGNQSGEEPCIPLVSTTTDAQVLEAQALAEAEAQAEALEALKYVQSERVTLTSGAEVRVGQIVMFVSLEERYLDEAGKSMIAALMSGADSDVTEIAAEGSLWAKMTNFFSGFVDGILTIVGLKTEIVETDKLCIGTTCVTEEQLQAMLEGSANLNTGSEPNEENNTTSEEEVVASDPEVGGDENPTESATTTEPVVEENSNPVETPIVESTEPEVITDTPLEVTETPVEEVEVVAEEPVTEVVAEEPEPVQAEAPNTTTEG